MTWLALGRMRSTEIVEASSAKLGLPARKVPPTPACDDIFARRSEGGLDGVRGGREEEGVVTVCGGALPNLGCGV